MATPEPRITRSVDASAWSPPLPEASGFDHLVVETPGLRTHLAAIGEGEPVVLLHGSGGVLASRELTYAPQLARMGVAALVVDSFGARRDRGTEDGHEILAHLAHIADALYRARTRIGGLLQRMGPARRSGLAPWRRCS